MSVYISVYCLLTATSVYESSKDKRSMTALLGWSQVEGRSHMTARACKSLACLALYS